MNKKEVSEIKSLFKRDGGAIDRICGCLIDGEQQIRMTFSDMFLSLSQEEIDKYFEIFRKALSGSLGKNLHSLDYTLDQELSGEGHKRLMQLKATGLKDETVLEEFYKSVAETMKGKPVIIRTLDIGGDKEIPYLGLEKEDNPFLGYRAIRFCLQRTDIYNTQLRALVRP